MRTIDITINSQNKCVIFYTMCVISELFEFNRCDICDTQKNIKFINFDTGGS